MRKAGLLAILLLAGCVSTEPKVRPLRPLEIATAPYQEVEEASMEGSLMYEGGCLLFHDEGSKALLMPVWPIGSSFNGTALLFHKPGKADQWVAVNQEILLSGQSQQWAAYGAPAYEPFQRQCGGYLPFFVSSVRPGD